MARKSAWLLFLFLLCVLACTDFAAWAGYYMDPSQVDIVHILAPPPSPNSAEGQSDLRAVLTAQHARTESQIAAAKADTEESIFRFTAVMGPGFKSDDLPFSSVFFRRVTSDADEVVAVAKAHFNRPRPFVVDPDVKPIVGRPSSASYPGGHATFSYIDAIMLAYMVPERAEGIFRYAAAYANSRVIGGVHYPTDSQAGLICASVIANVMLHERRFLVDFSLARTEVRHAVGLQ
jgi:acid phosphatase (class A)